MMNFILANRYGNPPIPAFNNPWFKLVVLVFIVICLVLASINRNSPKRPDDEYEKRKRSKHKTDGNQ
jgi:hypothetical protein